mmetsp:Transcript_27642/g.81072  ORF Transcript_27642/g.81072 Transcript_27642/m.81072 type:complete len:203 (-) Transcript_27642:2858-3466(-)
MASRPRAAKGGRARGVSRVDARAGEAADACNASAGCLPRPSGAAGDGLARCSGLGEPGRPAVAACPTGLAGVLVECNASSSVCEHQPGPVWRALLGLQARGGAGRDQQHPAGRSKQHSPRCRGPRLADRVEGGAHALHAPGDRAHGGRAYPGGAAGRAHPRKVSPRDAGLAGRCGRQGVLRAALRRGHGSDDPRADAPARRC